MTIPSAQCPPPISYSAWKGKEIYYCLFKFAALIIVSCTLYADVFKGNITQVSLCSCIHMRTGAGCY